MRAPKGRWASALVLTSSLAVALLLAESCLRLCCPVTYGEPRQDFSDVPWMAALHRPSDVPGLAFEMAPHREKLHFDVTIRTNRFGMRDDEVTIAKPDSVRRIAAIGDSYILGFGVPVDRNLPSRLEQILNEWGGEPTWEVLNFGVSGYTTRDEALVLKHKALRFEPDVILLSHVFNDPEIDPLLRPHNHFREPDWWQHVHLLRLLAKARRDLDIKRTTDGNYTRYLYENPERWGSVVRGFEDIAALARARDIPVLVVVFPFFPRNSWDDYKYRPLHGQVVEAAGAAGLEALDLYDLFAKRDPAELRRSINDLHPNAEAYELVAREVAASLERLRPPTR
jgi:lysophospholipase L1-like esterase